MYRFYQKPLIFPDGMNMANGGIEAGDNNFYFRRVCVQMISKNRGLGKSVLPLSEILTGC